MHHIYQNALSVNAGGLLEVFHIMRKAPVSWGPILLISSIKDSSKLYPRVMEHEEALLDPVAFLEAVNLPLLTK